MLLRDPVGALGCNTVKTLRGFAVTEHVCLELYLVIWVWFASQKGGGSSGWKMWTALWFWSSRHGGQHLIVPISVVELKIHCCQPRCLCLLTSSLHSPPQFHPNQLYQHDKSMWNTAVTTLLSFPTRFCLSDTFPMWVLGITTALCVHEKTHLPHSFSHIYLQTSSTTDPNISVLNDELAALRQFWFGKPVSGQCYTSLVFDNHPRLCPSISTYSQLLLNDTTHEHIFIFVSQGFFGFILVVSWGN